MQLSLRLEIIFEFFVHVYFLSCWIKLFLVLSSFERTSIPRGGPNVDLDKPVYIFWCATERVKHCIGPTCTLFNINNAMEYWLL